MDDNYNRRLAIVLAEGSPMESDLADAFDEMPTLEDLHDAEEQVETDRIRLQLRMDALQRDTTWLRAQFKEHGVDYRIE